RCPPPAGSRRPAASSPRGARPSAWASPRARWEPWSHPPRGSCGLDLDAARARLLGLRETHREHAVAVLRLGLVARQAARDAHDAAELARAPLAAVICRVPARLREDPLAAHGARIVLHVDVDRFGGHPRQIGLT